MRKILFLFALAVTQFAAVAQYEVGSQVADFSLKNIDDKLVSLADYPDAKGFIITFTCNHCPYSVAYEDRILALDAAYKAKGYPVIAINPNDAVAYPEDSFEQMKVRARDKGFSFPYLHDETQEVAKTFGATKTPHMFVVQKVAGQLKVVYIGAIDDNSKDATAVTERYLENALNELLAGKAISKPFTRAVGCGVKYKKS